MATVGGGKAFAAKSRTVPGLEPWRRGGRHVEDVADAEAVQEVGVPGVPLVAQEEEREDPGHGPRRQVLVHGLRR